MNRVAAIIPFRKNSKGLPNKNTTLLGGLPLWVHSLHTAFRAKLVDEIIITTDDEGVLNRDSDDDGLIFVRRPPELADDVAPLDAAIIHAIDDVGFEGTLVVLQPTVPIRREGLVDECIRALWAFPDANSLVTVNRLHFVWNEMGEMVNGPRVNRQDMTTHLFEEDGSVFVVPSEVLRESGCRVAPPVILYHADRTVDIDDAKDFKLAGYLLESA